MDDERIDLSALDPARDGERWQQRADAIAARALAARRARAGLQQQLRPWARPALAMAAALALVAWGLALGLPRRPAPAAVAPAPAEVELIRWTAADRVPAPAEVLAAFAGGER